MSIDRERLHALEVLGLADGADEIAVATAYMARRAKVDAAADVEAGDDALPLSPVERAFALLDGDPAIAQAVIIESVPFVDVPRLASAAPAAPGTTARAVVRAVAARIDVRSLGLTDGKPAPRRG